MRCMACAMGKIFHERSSQVQRRLLVLFLCRLRTVRRLPSRYPPWETRNAFSQVYTAMEILASLDCVLPYNFGFTQ
jgi:hypothetical protein